LYLLALSLELVELGHHVAVMLANADAMNELAEQFDPRVEIIRISYTNTYLRRFRSLGSRFDTRQIRMLCDQFRLGNPDLIHLNLQNLEDGMDLVQAAECSPIPYVMTVHNTHSLTELGARFGAMRDMIARRVLRSSSGAIITISHACYSQVLRFLGGSVNTSRTICIPNGVRDIDLGGWHEYRNEWSCTASSFVLGCTARIEKEKNPMFAVKLVSTLPEHVKLVWVGDGTMRAELESLAAQLGVSHRVHVDGWRRDAKSRMGSFDAFILPSLYEGLPLALLEAMACGLPIIASSVDGMADVIHHGVNGLLAPPNDLEAWGSCVKSLVDSPDRRKSLGAAAYQSFLSKYSAKASAEATVAVYQQVIDRFAANRAVRLTSTST
jgi:glycosyltransferase involved in cell wall biosynthesis